MIRRALLEDCDDILRLAHDLSPLTLERAELACHLQSLLEAGDHRVWVAEVEGVVVAWLHAFITQRVVTGPFVEIGGLMVKDAHLRANIGHGLVQQAAAWSHTKGLNLRVRCHSQRLAAHRFYLAIGFEPTKQQQVFEFKGSCLDDERPRL